MRLRRPLLLADRLPKFLATLSGLTQDHLPQLLSHDVFLEHAPSYGTSPHGGEHEKGRILRQGRQEEGVLCTRGIVRLEGFKRGRHTCRSGGGRGGGGGSAATPLSASTRTRRSPWRRIRSTCWMRVTTGLLVAVVVVAILASPRACAASSAASSSCRRRGRTRRSYGGPAHCGRSATDA